MNTCTYNKAHHSQPAAAGTPTRCAACRPCAKRYVFSEDRDEHRDLYLRSG